MAKIIIENATVRNSRQGPYGVGVGVYETFTRRDESEGRNFFMCWFKEDPGLVEGQVVSVSGFHSVKVREYESNGETRHTADVSVNGARLIATDGPVAAASSPEPAAPSQQSWHLPAASAQEPF